MSVTKSGHLTFALNHLHKFGLGGLLEDFVIEVRREPIFIAGNSIGGEFRLPSSVGMYWVMTFFEEQMLHFRIWFAT